MAVPHFAHRGTQYPAPETLTDEQREGLETVAMLQIGRTAADTTWQEQEQEQGQASSAGAASSSQGGIYTPPWDWSGNREAWFSDPW